MEHFQLTALISRAVALVSAYATIRNVPGVRAESQAGLIAGEIVHWSRHTLGGPVGDAVERLLKSPGADAAKEELKARLVIALTEYKDEADRLARLLPDSIKIETGDDLIEKVGSALRAANNVTNIFSKS